MRSTEIMETDAGQGSRRSLRWLHQRPQPPSSFQPIDAVAQILVKTRIYSTLPSITDRLGFIYDGVWSKDLTPLYPEAVRNVVHVLWTGRWGLPEEVVLPILEWSVYVPAWLGSGHNEESELEGDFDFVNW